MEEALCRLAELLRIFRDSSFFFLFIGHSRRAAMCYLGFALPIKAILYLLAGREEIISPYEKPTSPNQICSIALFSAK
jgi:hypothetical protein